MAFVIAKSSREPTRVSYNGPACQPAGVIGGRVYAVREEAEADAKKLAEVNPIGFYVSEIPDSET